jgi:hypothetical protein
MIGTYHNTCMKIFFSVKTYSNAPALYYFSPEDGLLRLKHAGKGFVNK